MNKEEQIALLHIAEEECLKHGLKRCADAIRQSLIDLQQAWESTEIVNRFIKLYLGNKDGEVYIE